MAQIDPETLGKRLKFFRERAHISQFELENRMSAANGMISRIEKGKVNPSKETILTIAEQLSLNNKQIDYLIGQITLPASQDEINKAINHIKDYFSKKSTFAYLLDERWRVHYVSEGMKRLLTGIINDPDEAIQSMYGKTILYALLNKGLNISELLFQNKYYENDFLNFQFARYYHEAGFMCDDPSFIETIDLINHDKKLLAIWEKSQKQTVNINNLASKIVKMKIYGLNVSLNYAREMLPIAPRFETIELFPTNRFLRLLLKA